MLSFKALLILSIAGFLSVFLAGILASLHVRRMYSAAVAALLIFTGFAAFWYMVDSRLSIGVLIFSGFMALFVGAVTYLSFTFVKVNWRKGPHK